MLQNIAQSESGDALGSMDALDCFTPQDFPPDDLLYEGRTGHHHHHHSSMMGVNASFTSGIGDTSMSSLRGTAASARGGRRGEDDLLSTPSGGHHYPPSSTLDTSAAMEAVALSINEDTQLLRDCLFLFQGINGQYIRYEPRTGTHIIDPQLQVSVSKKDVVMHCAEMGWLFRKVSAFADRAQSLPDMGLVGQALCFVLQVMKSSIQETAPNPNIR